MREIIKICLYGKNEDLVKEVSDFKKDFKTQDPEIIAENKGMKGYGKYVLGDKWKKGTPFHVKSAVVYNNFIKKFGLEGKYKLLTSGEKIKLIAVNKNSIFDNSMVAFTTPIPKEMDLKNQVNYEQQWQKIFVMPLRKITDVLGWNIEPKRKKLF